MPNPSYTRQPPLTDEEATYLVAYRSIPRKAKALAERRGRAVSGRWLGRQLWDRRFGGA